MDEGRINSGQRYGINLVYIRREWETNEVPFQKVEGLVTGEEQRGKRVCFNFEPACVSVEVHLG